MGQTREQRVIKQLSDGAVQKQTAIATDMYLPNHSGITSHPETIKHFVPYSGANKDIDIGNNKFTANGNVSLGSNGTNTNLTKYGNTLGDEFYIGTNAAGRFQRASGNSECFRTQIKGDTEGRWVGTSSGVLRWGDGTNATDVNLYRNAADELKTDDNFIALSFSIGANTLTTSEWAYLDGQDQAVKSTSSAKFANLGLCGSATNSTYGINIVPNGSTYVLGIYDYLSYTGTDSVATGISLTAIYSGTNSSSTNYVFGVNGYANYAASFNYDAVASGLNYQAYRFDMSTVTAGSGKTHQFIGLTASATAVCPNTTYQGTASFVSGLFIEPTPTFKAGSNTPTKAAMVATGDCLITTNKKLYLEGAYSNGLTLGSQYIYFDGTDLNMVTTGVLKFGTYSAIGAETLQGYITIKDSAGNSRKLAVIA